MSPSRSRNNEGPTGSRQTQPARSNYWVWSSARPGENASVNECLFHVTNDKAWFVSGTFEDFGEHRSTCNIDHFPQRPEPYQEEVKGVGTVRLKVKQYLGNSELVSEGEVTLERVLYIPTMAHNLVCSLLVAGAGRVYNPENAIYGDGHRNGIRTPSPPPSPPGIFALFCATVNIAGFRFGVLDLPGHPKRPEQASSFDMIEGSQARWVVWPVAAQQAWEAYKQAFNNQLQTQTQPTEE